MTTQEKIKKLGNQPVSAEIFFKQNGEASEDCPFEATTYPGMTLRQYYAGLAMQGLLSNSNYQYTDPEDFINAAINYSNMLLDKLSKTYEP